MLFKILFALLKKLRWVISLLLLAGAVFLLATQYQAIKVSPLGGFLPDLSWDTLKTALPSNIPPLSTLTPTQKPTEQHAETKQLTIATEKGPINYTIEIADSDEERALGLMYRTSLAPYAGMYFEFSRDVASGFWMKNMEIPLDMIFIDATGKIIEMRENVRPCKEFDLTQATCPSYAPAAAYRAVLEINTGSSKANGIKAGQTIKVN